MRVIDLGKVSVVELWSGRRLYVPALRQLVALPKGAVSLSGRTLSFGSATKTTVQIVGGAEFMTTVFEAIRTMESPNAAADRRVLRAV